jgi:hypothetical protein
VTVIVGSVARPAAPGREKLSVRSRRPIERSRRWLGGLRLSRPRHPRLWAFGLYAVLGLLTAGWYAIRDPSTVCACIGNADPAEYMWSLDWWPHALVHGLNPFISHYVWAPTGANLARSATIPTAAFVMWPVTALFGPVVSYNVLSIASPILAAFTAYLLCWRITGRELPALAGGYIFGFGAYQFSQLVGHLNLSLVFLIPVMVLLALRRADDEISRRLYVGSLAAIFVLQLGLSTEVTATAVSLGLVSLVAARFLAPQRYRKRIERLIAESVGAGALAAIITSPFLYYAWVRGGQPRELAEISNSFGLDLFNPLIPTGTTWLGSHSFHAVAATFENANIAEADGYLSAPLVLAFLLWAFGTRRRFLARMLMIVAGLSFLGALGSHLHVGGTQTIGLPYDWVKGLPAVRLLTPSRIIMYTSLALAIGVAAWLSEVHARSARAVARWLVFALGAVLIFPNVASGLWGAKPSNPQLFRGTAYRHYLRAGESVLALPFAQNDNSMLWQAETGFYFRMPEGYLGHLVPPQWEGKAIVGALGSNKEVDPKLLAEFVRAYGVKGIVVDSNRIAPSPYAHELARLGLHGISLGGVVLYRVPSAGL